MLTGLKRIILADIGSVIDPDTGDRTKKVTNSRVVTGNVDIVGVNTQSVGQVAGFNLAYSIEVLRQIYSSEKYVYFDNKAYEIKTLSKAKSVVKMLLNVEIVEDKEITTILEEFANDL